MQVHEKTILLVTLPVMLYYQFDPLCVLWFLHIATFSMLPLLSIDQLIFPTIVLTFIYLILIRIAALWSNDAKASAPLLWDVLSLSSISDNKLFIGVFYVSSFVGCSSLLVGHVFVRPPDSLPFLFQLLISAYSCAHFVLFFIYFNFRQIFGGGVLVDTTQRVTHKAKTNKTNVNKKKI